MMVEKSVVEFVWNWSRLQETSAKKAAPYFNLISSQASLQQNLKVWCAEIRHGKDTLQELTEINLQDHEANATSNGGNAAQFCRLSFF